MIKQLVVLLLVCVSINCTSMCNTALYLKSKSMGVGQFNPNTWDSKGPLQFSTDNYDLVTWYPKCDKSTFVGCGWTIIDTKTKEPMAKCVSGCPNTIEWDNDLASLQTWQTQQNGKWVTEPSVQISCCQFQPDHCDETQQKQLCKQYTTLSSCLFASTVTNRCCTAAGWIDQGVCLSAPIDHKCKV